MCQPGLKSQTEAQAGPVPHDLLRALDHRADLGTVRHLRQRIEGRPDALQRIGHRLPDPPADLREIVGELTVPVVTHGPIFPLARESKGPGVNQPSGSLSGLHRRHPSHRAAALSAPRPTTRPGHGPGPMNRAGGRFPARPRPPRYAAQFFVAFTISHRPHRFTDTWRRKLADPDFAAPGPPWQFSPHSAPRR